MDALVSFMHGDYQKIKNKKKERKNKRIVGKKTNARLNFDVRRLFFLFFSSQCSASHCWYVRKKRNITWSPWLSAIHLKYEHMTF